MDGRLASGPHRVPSADSIRSRVGGDLGLQPKAEVPPLGDLTP
jgi:hypothetical protein